MRLLGFRGGVRCEAAAGRDSLSLGRFRWRKRRGVRRI
jgi:hypothetical protein